ncbi:MAG TPA: DegT/DnrJ/EryC1/StrS family aminotransferase [Elusimicrobiota bacterium]|jgi:dTDP-4-amino-4,6-dideoxygalactose transaminase|nr:DegT/DnrJ/EryC1/StrS family aminotransferase [Elusimicrobiota bacterium]
MAAAPVKVPYVDLALQHRPLKAELLEAVGAVIDRGQFVLGDEVARFEERLAAACGTKYAVGLNSGTDALILALRALGVGPGDEVISPANSFVASASCAALLGATPVLADVGDDYNLDPAALERAVTPRTKVIIPVHLTGRPADMDAVAAIAKKRGIFIVEDCAQAVLAEYRGRRVGSFGAIGCFSLHPLKTLSALGDGGAAVTDDPVLRDKLLLLRNLGLQSRENCALWSGNSRLDTVQAAMLLVKFEHLDAWTEARRRHAAFYRRELAGIEGLRVPGERPHEKAVYHTFIVQAERRDELKAFLAARGVATAVHYPRPIHLQDAAASLRRPAGGFPVSEKQARLILSLPVYPELTPEQLAWVAESVRAFYAPSRR